MRVTQNLEIAPHEISHPMVHLLPYFASRWAKGWGDSDKQHSICSGTGQSQWRSSEEEQKQNGHSPLICMEIRDETWAQELPFSEIHGSWHLVKIPAIWSWPVTGFMTSWFSFGSRTQTLSIYCPDIAKWHFLRQLTTSFQFHTGFLPTAQKCMLLL